VSRTQSGQPRHRSRVCQTSAARKLIEIRQARSADHAALGDFLTGLSPRSSYLRFFTGAPSAGPAMVRILTGQAADVDAVVAAAADGIIGHAMGCDLTGPGGTCPVEIGVVVADDWQGLGVGSALVRTVLARAQARGRTAVTMEVLAENRQVIDMIAHLWPAARYEHSGAYVIVQARLPHSEHAIGRTPRPEEERRGEQLAISR
jgi:GNAT superfamily N-acetyltransferase